MVIITDSKNIRSEQDNIGQNSQSVRHRDRQTAWLAGLAVRYNYIIPGVPHRVVSDESPHSTANPKSAILMLASSSSDVSRRFSGFKSLQGSNQKDLLHLEHTIYFMSGNMRL